MYLEHYRKQKTRATHKKKYALTLSQNAIWKSLHSGAEVRNRIHGRMIVVSKPTERLLHTGISHWCVRQGCLLHTVQHCTSSTVFVEQQCSVMYVTTDVAKGTPGSPRCQKAATVVHTQKALSNCSKVQIKTFLQSITWKPAKLKVWPCYEEEKEQKWAWKNPKAAESTNHWSFGM